ncbi:MAG: hypothetical protein CVU39_12405 [Chloroflexi bacterium HGW-Chloroflexi-10]|nr:MAG: hypothetical protein CVU39_12405 [Chloroflexi bacterium HGW-Chloroflexi-10]
MNVTSLLVTRYRFHVNWKIFLDLDQLKDDLKPILPDRLTGKVLGYKILTAARNKSSRSHRKG